MPEFLLDKLRQEYGQNSDIPYKVANSIGAMHGNKITDRGRQMQAKHERDMASRLGLKHHDDGIVADTTDPLAPPDPRRVPVLSQYDMQEDQAPPTTAAPQMMAAAGPPMPSATAPVLPPAPPEASAAADIGQAGAMRPELAGPPQPQQAKTSTAPLDEAIKNYLLKLDAKTPVWRKVLAIATSLAPNLRAAGIPQQIEHPGLAEAAAHIPLAQTQVEEQRKVEASQGQAELRRLQMETQRSTQASLSDSRLATAEARAQNAQTFADRVKEQKTKHDQDYLLQSLGSKEIREDSNYQKAGDKMQDGYTFVPDPSNPGWGFAKPPSFRALPPELAQWVPGAQPGSMVSHSEYRKAMDYAQKGKLETVKAENKIPPVAKPQYTGAQRLALQAEGVDPDAQDLDPQVARRALEKAKERAPTTGNENARADKSYQFNVGELNKIGKPVADAVMRIGRLQDTLAQNNPQADALIAPELLTVMAGGAGSGLRMNEAEIQRIVGGRSHWENLKAAINKWQIDPTAARSITPAQQQQIRGLVQAVSTKLNTKQSAIDEAHQALTGTDDPAEHRRIVNTARQKFTATDVGAAGAAPKVADPLGIR